VSPIGSVTGQSIGASPAPPPSGGQVPQVYEEAFERYVPLPGFLRIDLEISGGDAFLQVLETIDHGAWEDPATSEMLLREGTHSIPLVRAAYGWRLRSASASAGVVIEWARVLG